MTGPTHVDGYYLHLGPSILPRHQHRPPISLAEALYRAYGLPYAVVYRLDQQGRPIPVVADAGNPDEVIHLPTSTRIPRHDTTRLTEPTKPTPGVVELTFGNDPWWTPHRRDRLITAVTAAGFAVTNQARKRKEAR